MFKKRRSLIYEGLLLLESTTDKEFDDKDRRIGTNFKVDRLYKTLKTPRSLFTFEWITETNNEPSHTPIK